MDERKIEQVMKRLEEKSTEELRDIWKKNDREEWSEEAFAAMKKILASRGGELPAQDEFTEKIIEFQCPECKQSEIHKHNSWFSVIILLILTIILGLARSVVFAGSDETAVVFQTIVGIGFLFMFIGTLLAFISAAFGRNRCKKCGFRWR